MTPDSTISDHLHPTAEEAFKHLKRKQIRETATLTAIISPVAAAGATAIYFAAELYTDVLSSFLLLVILGSSVNAFYLSVRWARRPSFSTSDASAEEIPDERIATPINSCPTCHQPPPPPTCSTCGHPVPPRVTIIGMKEIPLQLLQSLFFGCMAWIFFPLLISLQMLSSTGLVFPAMVILVTLASFPGYYVWRLGAEWRSRVRGVGVLDGQTMWR
ncbi:hypothetical protein BT69DRAFT_1323776 [Atractiella rhizophila]|nr:hypothetical protein BT69DRAFT_1323776 [Atractiella rhizophila]